MKGIIDDWEMLVLAISGLAAVVLVNIYGSVSVEFYGTVATITGVGAWRNIKSKSITNGTTSAT